MRLPIIAANWKMNKTREEARAFVSALRERIGDAPQAVEVVIAPPFTALDVVCAGIEGSELRLAAQNVCPEPSGAFTGEISPGMLADAGCHYGIVGHSERRALYGETDADVARKAGALLEAGIRPIVCVGETLEQREAGHTETVVSEQLAGSLAGMGADRATQLVVAYEPVWAIGTGRTATPEQAQEVHALVRARLCDQLGEAGQDVRIQYGGSVKPDNVSSLMAQPDIDGALVGGASLEPESFARIVAF